MKKRTLLILASTAVIAAGGTTAVNAASGTTAHSTAKAFDGDADVFGSRVNLEAETTAATTRVTFVYGGKRFPGRLTQTDAEDNTKDWDRMTKSLKSDRRPGSVVKFRVRACSSAGCTTSRFQEIVEWDD